MKSCYLGISYSHIPMAENKKEIKTNQISFGNNYQRRSPIYQPLQETLNFVYRGIGYSTEKKQDFCATKLPQVYTEPFVKKLMKELGI